MLTILALAINIALLMLFLIALVFYIFMLVGGWRGAPFIPSSPRVVKDMVSLARIKPGEIVFDLGSGDGRILIAAAQAGALAQGWEIHPLLVGLTRLKVWWLKLGQRVEVDYGNFWQADLKEADVIMVYLITHRMLELKEKLIREAKQGARVVSHAFKVPGWEPESQLGEARLYLVPRFVPACRQAGSLV